jgi:hypothetical protein
VVDEDAPRAHPRSPREHLHRLDTTTSRAVVIRHLVWPWFRPHEERVLGPDARAPLLLWQTKEVGAYSCRLAVPGSEAVQGGVLKARSDVSSLDTGLEKVVDRLPPGSGPYEIVLCSHQ